MAAGQTLGDEDVSGFRAMVGLPVDSEELQGLFDRPDVVDTLGLAVLAARAFEVMLDRWCGLGLWEYRAGFEASERCADITTAVDVAYSLNGRTGAAIFYFEFPTMVAM